MCSSFIKDAVIKSVTRQYEVTSYTTEEIISNTTESVYVSEEEEIGVPDPVMVIRSVKKADRRDVVAGIYIESVGMHLPILNGITQQNLLVGAATMKEDQVMGEGNYYLAGHNMKDSNILFGPLMNISKGDLIYLTDKEYLYVYQTVSIETVHETKVDVLEEGEKAEITLITCSVAGYITDYRLVVKGELLEVIPIPSDEIEITESIEVKAETEQKDETEPIYETKTETTESSVVTEQYLTQFLGYVEEVEKIKTLPSNGWIGIVAGISFLLVCLCRMLLKKIEEDEQPKIDLK